MRAQHLPGGGILAISVHVAVEIHGVPQHNERRRVAVVDARPPGPGFWNCKRSNDMNIPAKLPKELVRKHVPVAEQVRPALFRLKGEQVLYVVWIVFENRWIVEYSCWDVLLCAALVITENRPGFNGLVCDVVLL